MAPVTDPRLVAAAIEGHIRRADARADRSERHPIAAQHELQHREMIMATWQPDPSFYPSPRQAAKAPAETLAYVAAFDPARKAATPSRSSTSIRNPRPIRRSSARSRCQYGRRAASFRLERLLVVPVPERAASACRAALSRGAGPALLAHLHPRHQARSAQAADRQDDRAGGDRREDRLHAPAHRALRPGRHLRDRARQHGRQGARRHLRDGPRELRAARPLGGRPRAAAARL